MAALNLATGREGGAVPKTIAVLGSALFFAVAPSSVTGLYRYVRNPIYVALVAVILGQAALFGDQRLLLYGVLVWLAFHAFVVGYEEPALVHTFGTEYEDFRANVPRWIPRLTPWRAARRQNHS